MKKRRDQTPKKPFFARFLEGQEVVQAHGAIPPRAITLKAPSDDDEVPPPP